MATRFQQRRDTSARWFAQNPVLADGEIGYETDTGVIKFGNGSSRWTDLKAALGSEYLPKLGKAEDSQRLDGLDSTEFLRVGAKAVDSDKLDGYDSLEFHRTVNSIITSTTRPSSPGTGRKYLESDTKDIVMHNGTRWIKVGGPPRVIAHTVDIGQTGNIGTQANLFSAVRQLNLPAHTAGLVRLKSSFVWAASTGQALHASFNYGTTSSPPEVEGVRTRTHNNSVQNGSVGVFLDGYWDSDGTAKTNWLFTMCEAVTATFILSGSMTAFLVGTQT